MRIIDGDALFEDLKECMKDLRLTPLQINGIALAATRIFEQPTIECEHEKGRWIISSDGYYPYCSECRKEPKSGDMTDFCPNCGADMRGKNNGKIS